VSFLAPSPFSAARTDEASSRRKGFETSPSGSRARQQQDWFLMWL
jgi:hypothetical protein